MYWNFPEEKLNQKKVTISSAGETRANTRNCFLPLCGGYVFQNIWQSLVFLSSAKLSVILLLEALYAKEFESQGNIDLPSNQS